MPLLALHMQRDVDETGLDLLKTMVRYTVAASPILVPTAFCLSVLSPDATELNAVISLAYLGGLNLAVGLLLLGGGLVRSAHR